MSIVKYVAATAVVVGGLVALDATVLKGQQIYDSQSNFSGSQTFLLPLDQNTTRHTVQIETLDRLMLEWRLLDPQGQEVVSERELASYRGARRFSFTPEKSGNYRLVVKGGVRAFEDQPVNQSGRVRVLVGDHRVIAPLLALFNR